MKCLGVYHYAEVLRDFVSAVFSNNTTILIYLNRESDTNSTFLNMETQEIPNWEETHSVQILTQFAIPYSLYRVDTAHGCELPIMAIVLPLQKNLLMQPYTHRFHFHL
ncbi:hypothetical protein E2C01_033016 [Portunus trituberculatus]|uniref:Uncharacterized protein n=1 Tax=Portunus trituberculatus TaxID=210409 RepID=A0A5B7F2M7_PORTR|nr:hypothetical protein [Portunus trituberculatus]